MNADDISYLDPSSINGLNLYAYCVNNPVMMTDSTGHSPFWGNLWKGLTTIGGAALGFLVGGPVGAIIGAGLGYGLGSMTSGAGGQMLENGANAIGSALSSAWNWAANAATTAWNATVNFLTNTVPDFFVNTVWNGWVVDKTWNKFMVSTIYGKGLKPAGLWVWNDVLKPASQNPIVNGIISIGGLVLAIVGAIITAPIWGAVVFVAGMAASVISVILWFRTLFD